MTLPEISAAISAETQPDDATIAAIADGLNAYNTEASGVAFAPEPLWVVARDAGRVTGGIKARLAWGWIAIEWLWVDEAWRGRGLGSALIRRAEQEAIARGCTAAFLDTFSFQAPGFYARHGYTPFGTLDGIPPGHSRIYLAKRLTGPSGA